MSELAARYTTEQTRPIWDSVIGEKLLSADAEAAIAFAKTLPAETRRKLETRIAPKLALTDLARGTAFALRIDNESARISATDSIYRQLSQRSVQATIDWIWTLPEELQIRSVASIVPKWYGVDEAAAKKWVASLPPGEVRDAAAFWLASEVGRTDPAAAAKIANSINNPRSKQIALDDLQR